MAEPSITAGIIAAGGVTLFGVSTGLDPSLLIAGFAGSAWAQSYCVPTAIWRRAVMMLIASVIAGYLSPSLAALAAASSDALKDGAPLQLPAAVLIGLTTHQVLGPAVMRLAAKIGKE